MVHGSATEELFCFQVLSAKELIIKARMAEEMAEKLSQNIAKSEERAKLAEEKRQEKGFEMKKIEREYEVSGLMTLNIDHPQNFV